MCAAATLEPVLGPITLNFVTRVTTSDNNQAQFTLKWSTVVVINEMANKDEGICGL